MPVFQTCAELSFIFCTISLTQDSFPPHESVHPISIVDITIGRSVFSFSMLTIVLPFSYINCSSAPCECPKTILVSVQEVTYIPVAILERKDALSSTLPPDIRALIYITIAEHVDSTAMLLVVLPFTSILVARSIYKSAMSRLLVFLPCTFIPIAVGPIEDSLAFPHVLLPFTNIRRTITECIGTVSLSHIAFPIPDIDITIVVIHGSLSMLIITEPKTLVTIVVNEIICAYTMLLTLKPVTNVFLAI